MGTTQVVADGFGVIAEFGPLEKRPIASITKTITALVVLDAKPLSDAEDDGPSITFTETDVEILRETKAMLGSYEELSAGLTLSEKQAMTVMMLSSANNYATSLAVWAYGSMDTYLAAAHEWLDAHGLTGTSVSDASGLDDGSASTPSDLVTIGQLAMENPALASIVGTVSAEIPGVGLVRNGNKLLGTHGVDGIKTGTTLAAGACLLYSSHFAVGDHVIHVTGTTLGEDTHAQLREDVGAMLDSIQQNFHEVPVLTQGSEVGTFTTAWGETGTLLAADSLTELVWADTPISVSSELNTFSGGESGSAQGLLTISSGVSSRSVSVLLGTSIHDPGLSWRLSHLGELF
ncbi:D-alanyl-D-alanine carboxypeptidase family protein [Aurantimicrobium minutum]|uniref:D-alanyl-D-alanine carboxypeptidase family protein n=1 Tax=Aurantimicrobium minutum TaxID=708131 RepID=UPI0024772A87|nr:D-alanyl-D-alanine carboxypeptidase [Aurantimicrobium minutum]